jgi:putative two-component system response regulator
LIIEDSKDDTELDLRVLRRSGYKVISQRVETEAALLAALASSTWDLILCDYMLPSLSAERALEITRETLGDIPFIMLSGYEDEETALRMLKAGANDFIYKVNLSRLPIAVRREVTQAGDRMAGRIALEKAHLSIIEAWGKSLELRDIHTKNHTIRVTDLTLRLARALRVSSSEFRSIRYGSLLHDIGKMGIPDSVLLKRESLEPGEMAIMKLHPVIALEMLSDNDYLSQAIDIPYCHHEKWDGSGYPRGLLNTDIPYAARIFSPCDVYDALTSDRPYRRSWEKERAIEHIREGKGKSFDPAIVDKFIEVIE